MKNKFSFLLHIKNLMTQIVCNHLVATVRLFWHPILSTLVVVVVVELPQAPEDDPQKR